MANKGNKLTISKAEALRARKRATAPGTYPGQNRARTFKDRKKESRRKACRGKVRW